MAVDAALVDSVVEALQSYVDAGELPGLALAASHDGAAFVRTGIGTLTSGEPCPADVLVPMMSFGKTISATAVCQVHAGGGFGWDDLVTDYIPEYGTKGKESTTVRHLLTHAAGIPMAGVGARIPKPDDWNEALTAFCEAEAEWAPGSRTSYHGLSGVMLAAEVARRVSGRPFDDLYHGVVDPIGSTATLEIPAPGPGVVLPADPAELAQLSYHPSGGYFGRTDDILAVLHLHLSRGRWDGSTVLSEQAWGEMHRPQYGDEIEQCRKAGDSPEHEWWALGWLLRGDSEPGWPTALIAHWFGLAGAPSADAFSHAGTSTVLGVADPATRVAVAIATTSPLSDPVAVKVRATAARLLGAAAAS